MDATQPKPPKLLIVDDEVPILFALESYFGGAGFEVRCARGLADALALAAVEGFDLVIADLMLSASDEPEGIELLVRLRAAGKRPRVVFLTALACEETERRARERGADAYLRKPQPLGGLEALVRALLGAAARPEAPPTQPEDEP
jgi:DNA-binding response OmpR family regulator